MFNAKRRISLRNHSRMTLLFLSTLFALQGCSQSNSITTLSKSAQPQTADGRFKNMYPGEKNLSAFLSAGLLSAASCVKLQNAFSGRTMPF